MCHNKRENRKTGGGQYNKYILSDVEESVARLTGIHRSVEGIEGARSFGDYNLSILEDSGKENEDNELDMNPSTSSCVLNKQNADNNARSTSSAAKGRRSSTPSPNPKRFRPITVDTPRPALRPDLSNLLSEENKHLENIVQLMEEHRDEVRAQNQKFDRLCNILEAQFKARQLHDIEMEKNIREKNQLKLKLIEIETLKLSLEQEKYRNIL